MNEGLINKPMKDDDFQRIEKELHEQMYHERKQQSKVDLWYFDHNTAGPVSLESQKTFTSEETFYSLTDNDLEFSAETSPKTNDYPAFTQGLVQKVSEAGIVPLGNTSPNEVRQNGTFYTLIKVLMKRKCRDSDYGFIGKNLTVDDFLQFFLSIVIYEILRLV